MTLEETHNRFVVVVLSEDVRMDSGRMLAAPGAHACARCERVVCRPAHAEAMTDQS